METVLVFAPKSEINIFRKKLRINFDWPQSEEIFSKILDFSLGGNCTNFPFYPTV